MQQFLAFAAASAALFSLGLFAGQEVNRPADHEVVPKPAATAAASTSVSEERGDLLSGDSDEKPMPSPIMNASHQKQEEVTDRCFFPSTNDTEIVSHTTESEESHSPTESSLFTKSSNPKSRQQLEALIRRMFPDAGADTVSVWADAYDGMDPGEVEFILEQKRSLSSSLDSEIATAMLGTPLGNTSVESLLAPQSQSAVEHAQQAIRQNLRSAWTCGYRRTVILPDAVVNSAELSSGAPRAIREFRSFEPGHLLSSPTPTHVAIGAPSEWMMFGLEENVFTRRGDFVRLTDGRLGLSSATGTYPLAGCTPIPDSATSVRITGDGEIKYDDAGQTHSAGQIRIVELQEMHELTTVDGVFFEGGTPECREVTASEARLAICRLELSNVDSANDKQLLEMLREELP